MIVVTPSHTDNATPVLQMITLGGNAELELVDTIDPFSEGIIFSVMPPKKSWRNISNLSGGEKVRISTALQHASQVLSALLRPSVRWRLCLPYTYIRYKCYSWTVPPLLTEMPCSPLPCTLWTRLMLPSTSAMSLSLPTTSRIGRRTRNLSSFL